MELNNDTSLESEIIWGMGVDITLGKCSPKASSFSVLFPQLIEYPRSAPTIPKTIIIPNAIFRLVLKCSCPSDIMREEDKANKLKNAYGLI